MNLPVIVLGAGGHAGVVADTLLGAGIEVLGFTDNNPSKWGAELGGCKVLGGDEVMKRHAPSAVALANGIGSVRCTRARRDAFVRFRDLGYSFVSVVHTSAVVSATAVLGEGSQIMAGVVLQPGVVVGDNALINTGAIVDHDCVVGAHCHIAPGCTLSGSVHVGAETHIGTGATVIQGIRLGESGLVAAGAVVVADVARDAVVMGVPARDVGR